MVPLIDCTSDIKKDVGDFLENNVNLLNLFCSINAHDTFKEKHQLKINHFQKTNKDISGYFCELDIQTLQIKGYSKLRLLSL